MTENTAPYTGRPQPAFPTQLAPRPVTWHSRVLLIGVGVLALVAAILTAVGGQGFPGNAPVEQIYCFGLIVDLIAVTIAVGALTIVEFVRRGNVDRRARELDRRFSVFALLAVVFAGMAVVGWAIGGGVEQLAFLVQGVRGRYMYHTGGLVLTGIPWALAAIFGAWGLRPRAHPVTNVFAGVAILIWLLLTVITTIAALVYGAGLSD